ncbi:MAG: zinc-ribbon and FHA domain-containing protein [Propionibacteriaceae bacterium]|nr:zinc-ribbon and FHA domain-containing protein [Propionibacteriaceae bacterium]
MSSCPQCGQPVTDGVNFCSNCGASLRSNTGDTTRVIPVSQHEESSVELTDSHLVALKDVPAGSAVLVVVRGPNQGSKFLLDHEVVTAGRHPQSDIFLDDVTVSRHHAKISERGGHRWLADQNSLNGTYVNRTLIDGEVALRGGDEVQIGKFRLVYLVAPTGRN